MSGMTPDDDGLRKRFSNHPSHPTTRRRSRWRDEVTGSGPFGESPEAVRSIAGFQILMKADTQISRSGVSYVPN